MVGWYREDLAYIHDVGHADFARLSAPGILEILAWTGIRDGLVVDLGCGSGQWARELTSSDYRVLGIDISGAMIRLAREKAPEAEFREGSLYDTEIPPCGAVTAVGEVLNYLFDEEGGGLLLLFRRVYEALVPGGILVFDALGPDAARLRRLSAGEKPRRVRRPTPGPRRFPAASGYKLGPCRSCQR